MVLEATLICLDNSESSRNGDFIPNRLEAQRDASNLICGAKTGQNPENCVGLLSMAGNRVTVLVAPTPDMGRVLQGLHEVTTEGDHADVIRALKVAQLALKHRLNKNQRQRVVLFVGSELTTTEKQLETLGKSLKKNNIALDIISFGAEIESNRSKLQRLHTAVNSNDNSRLVECSSEVSTLLSDLVMSSSILRDPDAPEPAPGTGTEGGLDQVDPSADPELYMALQMSLQEERNRQARAAGTTNTAETGEGQIEAAGADNSAVETAPSAADASAIPTTAEIENLVRKWYIKTVTKDVSSSLHLYPVMYEKIPPQRTGIDEELRQALLLSLQDLATAASEPQIDGPGALSGTLPLAEGSTVGEAPAVHKPATLSGSAEVSETSLSELNPGINLNDPELLEALRISMQSNLSNDEGTRTNPVNSNAVPNTTLEETRREQDEKQRRDDSEAGHQEDTSRGDKAQ